MLLFLSLWSKKRERKLLHLIYLHKCRKRILSKLLREYWNVYFSTGWAGGGRFLLTCLFCVHAAADTVRGRIRVARTGDLRWPACLFSFLLSVSPGLCPCMRGLPPSALAFLYIYSLYIYLFIRHTERGFSEQSTDYHVPLLFGLSLEPC